MGSDEGRFLLTVLVYFIYGSSLVISILFTFFVEQYVKVEEILSFNLGQSSASANLGRTQNLFDLWMINHNKLVGPIMIILSLANIKLCVYLTKVIFTA
ncbi:MAG: hypothetical protein NT033_06250 [Candidatus Omnitrophica bacterium]|nr:hypothetical protein [Candidatus Omnitrophota bacterium]